MNTKQYAKLAAVGIGATLVLNAVTTLVRILTQPRATFAWSDLTIGMAFLLLVLLLAWVVFRYACSLELDESVPSGMNVLEAGVRLLGAYWIVSAIPYGVLGVFLIMRQTMYASSSLDSAEIIRPLVYALSYGLAGFCFTRRTEAVKKLVGMSDGA